MNAQSPKLSQGQTPRPLHPDGKAGATNLPNLIQPEVNDFIPYAAQVDSAMRLEACGGDYALFLRKECERLDVIFEPLKSGVAASSGSRSAPLRRLAR